MQPDTQRQWFVYFKEKEMGPFSEAEVRAKLASRDLDDTAYLFTEGMTDWTLVQELALFKPIDQAAEVPKAASTTATPPAQTTPAQATGPTTSPSAAAPQATASVAKTGFGSSMGEKSASGVHTNSAAQAARAAAASAAKGASSTEVRTASEPTQKLDVAQLGAATPSTTATATPTASAAASEPAAPAPEKTQKTGRSLFSSSKPRPKWTTPLLFALLAASAGYYWWDQNQLMPPRERGDETSAPKQAPSPVAPPAASKDIVWTELLAARQAQGTEAPFRLDAKAISGTRPILLGALATSLKADYIHVMIFPDDERSLLPVARVWYFLVPVIDGLFSVGPLNVDGEPLPAGTYHVMIAHKGTFLGEAGFEHGTWPTAAELAPIQAKLEQDRALLAQKEKAALESKLQQVQNAAQQLEMLGRSALQGKTSRKTWLGGAQAWRTAFVAALEEQRKIVVSPTFFRREQSQLYELMDELYALHNSLDRASQGTPAAFLKNEKPGVGERWASFRKNQEALAGALRVLDGSVPSERIRIDREALKKQLESQHD